MFVVSSRHRQGEEMMEWVGCVLQNAAGSVEDLKMSLSVGRDVYDSLESCLVNSNS